MDITLDPGKTEWLLKVLSYSLMLPLVLSLQTGSKYFQIQNLPPNPINIDLKEFIFLKRKFVGLNEFSAAAFGQ